MKIYYVITAPGTKKLSIYTKLEEALDTKHEWSLQGFSPEIETVKEEDLSEEEREWLGFSK